MTDVPHVFVSDVHLRYDDRPYLDRFLAFLRAAPGLARRVVIHGDLFDFYVGPKQGARAFYRPLFDGVRDLVRQGVAVTLLHGNRDYLIGRDFVAAGATVVPDVLELELGGRRVRVSHGDELCVGDLSYQRAKRILRSGPVVALTRALPVSAATFAAKLYRRVSARKARRFAASPRGSRLDSILEGARDLVLRASYDVLVAGHIHHFAETPLKGRDGPVRLLTTGAWDEWGEGPNGVVFDGRDFALRRFAT